MELIFQAAFVVLCPVFFYTVGWYYGNKNRKLTAEYAEIVSRMTGKDSVPNQELVGDYLTITLPENSRFRVSSTSESRLYPQYMFVHFYSVNSPVHFAVRLKNGCMDEFDGRHQYTAYEISQLLKL